MPQCVLTLYSENGIQFTNDGTTVEYTFPPIGKARIGLPTFYTFQNNPQVRPVLAGICRNRFENGEEPILITQEFLDKGLSSIEYPKTFKEKTLYLLKYMYDKGGSENREFDVHSYVDYPLCFSDNEGEFERIISNLYDRGLITFWAKGDRSGRYYPKLTPSGINEIEKGLPKIPLIGLVSQVITTGDRETDNSINHAKDLFFREPTTMDNMRNACETLSYILEPLRRELETYFLKSDVQAFFHIVNEFDVRHNKQHTKEIEHPEQLEWVFYALLNTINAYTKLKQRQHSS